MKVKNHYYEILLSNQKEPWEIDMIEGEEIMMMVALSDRPKFIKTSEGMLNTAYLIGIKKVDWDSLVELSGQDEETHKKFMNFGNNIKLLESNIL